MHDHKIPYTRPSHKTISSNFIRPVKGGHVLIQADKIGSTKSYLMSIARTKDGITKKMNERMNIFFIVRHNVYGFLFYVKTNTYNH